MLLVHGWHGATDFGNGTFETEMLEGHKYVDHEQQTRRPSGPPNSTSSNFNPDLPQAGTPHTEQAKGLVDAEVAGAPKPRAITRLPGQQTCSF